MTTRELPEPKGGSLKLSNDPFYKKIEQYILEGYYEELMTIFSQNMHLLHNDNHFSFLYAVTLLKYSPNDEALEILKELAEDQSTIFQSKAISNLIIYHQKNNNSKEMYSLLKKFFCLPKKDPETILNLAINIFWGIQRNKYAVLSLMLLSLLDTPSCSHELCFFTIVYQDANDPTSKYNLLETFDKDICVMDNFENNYAEIIKSFWRMQHDYYLSSLEDRICQLPNAITFYPEVLKKTIEEMANPNLIYTGGFEDIVLMTNCGYPKKLNQINQERKSWNYGYIV